MKYEDYSLKLPDEWIITFNDHNKEYHVKVPYKDFKKMSKLITKFLKENKINAKWEENDIPNKSK